MLPVLANVLVGLDLQGGLEGSPLYALPSADRILLYGDASADPDPKLIIEWVSSLN